MMQTPQNDSITHIFKADTVINDTAYVETDSIPDELTAYPSLISSPAIDEALNARPLHVQHQAFWVAGVLIGGFILLAWVRLFFRRRLDMIFRAVFAKNIANQLIREGNLFKERTGLILFIVYLSVMAMLLYQSILLFEIPINVKPWILYSWLLLGFLGIWLLKLFMVRGLALLFDTKEHSRTLLANMLLYNLFLGMVLLPVVSCMAYADAKVFFYIALVIIFLTYLFRIIREAIIGFNIIKFSVFHLILYLCTLEILPLIVLAKILTRNMTL